MNNSGDTKIRIFDAWFLVAVVGFTYFVYIASTVVVTGMSKSIQSNVVLVAFIAFISFTSWLAGKVQFKKRNPAKWLFAQTFFSAGGFLWYYLAVFRKRIVNEM